MPVQTAMRNCTRDEGRLFEVGNQVLISSHRKLVRQSHACNPHGAIIALQHPDISLVWVGSKARITAPQHYCPLHPNYPTLVVHHWHFAFVPILLQKSQIARRQFSCCKKNPTDDRRSMWPQSRYRGRQRVYLQAMRSPTYLHESRVYSQKKF
jgi:hypothetical protein